MKNGETMTSFRTTHPDILSTSNGGIYHYIPLQANRPGTWLTTVSMTIEKDGSVRSYAGVDFNLPQLPLRHVGLNDSTPFILVDLLIAYLSVFMLSGLRKKIIFTLQYLRLVQTLEIFL